MLTVKARVRDGRLVLDEATDLHEGEEVELVAVMENSDDGLDEGQRSALHAALERAKTEFESGQLIDGQEVLARMQARYPR